ncbi:MAG TPA: GNAT family N-acetyltransferase [Burkholderiales bacterium]|nr:GNAT family N-acetyltransferase [Burkholderiales bacterium]
MDATGACDANDVPAIFEIINDAAQAYKGVIPDYAWHEPYMPLADLESEIGKGVRFYGFGENGRLLGVMGIQDVKDVTLIRHAYVRTAARRGGIGRRLLGHLCALARRPVLIGTWRAADWAIRFYEKNGFTLVGEAQKARLLGTYWTVSERQAQDSVVLADAKALDGVAGRRG